MQWPSEVQSDYPHPFEKQSLFRLEFERVEYASYKVLKLMVFPPNQYRCLFYQLLLIKAQHRYFLQVLIKGQ